MALDSSQPVLGQFAYQDSNPSDKGEKEHGNGEKGHHMLEMKDKIAVALGTIHVTIEQVAARFEK